MTTTRSRYLTTGQAAERAGVAYATIDTWRRRGKLTPVAFRGGRMVMRDDGTEVLSGARPLYRARDVMAAERATRRSGVGRKRGPRSENDAGLDILAPIDEHAS